MLLVLVGEQEPLGSEMIPIMGNVDQLPTEEAKNISREIHRSFLNSAVIKGYIDRLARRSRPIRRGELLSHISNIHLLALETIMQVFENKGLKPPREAILPISELEEKVLQIISSIDFIEQLEKDTSETATEQFFAALDHTHAQLNLIVESNQSNLSEFKNRNFVIRDFPEEYLNKIEELLYPEWYTACFMSDCSNASVWGHYGNKHAGVCLKFRSSLINGLPSINLHGVNGWSGNGPMRGPRDHQFHKVKYENNFAEVDFFRSLGRLPIPTLGKFWFTNEDGERSKCADEILSPSNNEWRESYWAKFQQGMTTKSNDWDYEKEYRLILSSSIFDFSEPTDRKLQYNFNDLDGIIFGINTKVEDKLRIVKIIGEKCEVEGREDFNFYQAFYSQGKGCIDFAPLGLIKFSKQPEVKS